MFQDRFRHLRRVKLSEVERLRMREGKSVRVRVSADRLVSHLMETKPMKSTAQSLMLFQLMSSSSKTPGTASA